MLLRVPGPLDRRCPRGERCRSFRHRPSQRRFRIQHSRRCDAWRTRNSMNPDRVRPSRTSLTHGPRQCAVVLVAVLVGTASCSTSAPDGSAGAKPEAAAAPTNASEPTGSSSAAPTSISVADIAATGLGVYADAGQLIPIYAVPAAIEPTPFRLLSEQLDAELVEAAAGQGVLGADFDRVIGAEPGLPPPSFLVAGWVSASGSPGASPARRIIDDHDWTKAPQTLFPGLVLALYSADAARFADALAGPLTPTPSDTTAPTDTTAPAETTRPAGFRNMAALSLPDDRRVQSGKGLRRQRGRSDVRCTRPSTEPGSAEHREQCARLLRLRHTGRVEPRHRCRQWPDRCRALPRGQRHQAGGAADSQRGR